MLDLNSRVHLDEDVVAALVEKELDGARARVSDLLREGDGVGTDLGAQLFREIGRRSELDHLLVATLQRAVTLEEVDDVALLVGEDLHFDVPGVDDGLLEEDRRIAEGRFRFACCGFDRFLEL